MNRRAFLRWMGVGTVAVVAAPAALKAMGPAPVTKSYNFVQQAALTPPPELVCHPVYIAEYNEYANFSSFALESAIDESVENAAKQLAEAHGNRIERLVSQFKFFQKER